MGPDMKALQQKPAPINDQSRDFAPMRILEIELERPLPIIPTFDAARRRSYRRALCLVRLHTQPLGLVELNFDGDELDPEEYVEKIWLALNVQINEHLRQDGLPSATALTANGLPSSNIPACIEERERFLIDAPLVSVIVSSRERPEQLAVCLHSLMSLRYPHYEVVVVDNAPRTNATINLIQELSQAAPFIRYVREDCPGLSWARNRGIMVAKGEILAFTDDDVVVDPYWLTSLAKEFGTAEDVACVTGLALPLELESPAQFLFEAHGGFNKGCTRRVFTPQRKNYYSEMPLYPYTAGRFGAGVSMAFKADFLRQVGGFDPALGGSGLSRNGQDIAMFHQVIFRGYHLVYQPGALLYHLHRRDYAGLCKQVYGYAIGISASLTKAVLENPLHLIDLFTKLPYGLYFIFGPRSPKNRKRSKDYPKELTTLELKGMLYGPFAYILSRITASRMRQKFVIVEKDTHPFTTGEGALQ